MMNYEVFGNEEMCIEKWLTVLFLRHSIFKKELKLQLVC